MISLALAQELKEAGLLWQTNMHDFFAIPERGMDDRLFVIADMMAYTDLIRGWPVVAFHGTAEWALDYIMTAEVVWMPTESQLREALVERLAAEGAEVRLSLSYGPDAYRCTAAFLGQDVIFEAASGEGAYARALLHVLRSQDRSVGV